MLFGVLKHFDSLRELEIGMKAEAHKLQHLDQKVRFTRGEHTHDARRGGRFKR